MLPSRTTAGRGVSGHVDTFVTSLERTANEEGRDIVNALDPGVPSTPTQQGSPDLSVIHRSRLPPGSSAAHSPVPADLMTYIASLRHVYDMTDEGTQSDSTAKHEGSDVVLTWKDWLDQLRFETTYRQNESQAVFYVVFSFLPILIAAEIAAPGPITAAIGIAGTLALLAVVLMQRRSMAHEGFSRVLAFACMGALRTEDVAELYRWWYERKRKDAELIAQLPARMRVIQEIRKREG